MFTTNKHILIPKEYLNGRDQSEFVALQFKGDDLYPLYQDGDTLLIHTTVEAAIGDVAIAHTQNGMLIGQIENGKSGKQFQPLNTWFPPLRANEYKILGVPVFLMRDFRPKCDAKPKEVAA